MQMTWVQLMFGIMITVSSLAIIIVVILQEGRQAGLSGAIAGGADTFFGKHKGRTIEKKLEKATKYIAIFFFVVSLTAFLIFLFI